MQCLGVRGRFVYIAIRICATSTKPRTFHLPNTYNDLVNPALPHWWNSRDKTFSTVLGVIIFVTGNAGKFDEDRQILAQREGSIDIGSRVLDWFSVRQSVDELALVPEIQGTTQEIAVEKCRCAAELVSFPVLSRIFRTVS